MKSVQKRSAFTLLILTLMMGLLIPTIKADGGTGDERDELVPNDISEGSEDDDENDVEIESENSEIDDDLNMPDSEDDEEGDEEVIIHKGNLLIFKSRNKYISNEIYFR